MFLNQTIYSTGNNSGPGSVGDVNSDSQPDIVAADSSSQKVSVFLNAGNGPFLNHTTCTIGNSAFSVVVVDVNSDNKPDIIVACYASNYVGVSYIIEREWSYHDFL